MLQRADQETNSLLECYFLFWRPFFFLWRPFWPFCPSPTGKKVTLQRGDRESEASYTPVEFASELRRLAIAFGIAVENGEQCSMQIAGERITIPTGARFSIEYEREGNEEELELQIKWTAKAPSRQETSGVDFAATANCGVGESTDCLGATDGLSVSATGKHG